MCPLRGSNETSAGVAMKSTELRKLLKEAAGPTPLPDALRARLEQTIQDESSRAALRGVGSPEPLSPFLRKRLEKQLTAPHRARRAYRRRIQLFAGAAASIIVLALPVGLVVSGGHFDALLGDGTSGIAQSPGVGATSKAKPKKSAGKPVKERRVAQKLPNQYAAGLSVTDPGQVPAQAPPELTDEADTSWNDLALHRREASCGTPDLGVVDGNVDFGTSDAQPAPTTTPSPEPAPSASAAGATSETTVAPASQGSSVTPTAPASPPPSPPAGSPSPDGSEQVFTSAANPVMQISIDLKPFEGRASRYGVLLVAYQDDHAEQCGVPTYFGEWNTDDPTKPLTDDTIARGTYLFRVILVPGESDLDTLVSAKFVADLK